MNVLLRWLPKPNSIQWRLLWQLEGLFLGALIIITLIWLPTSIKDVRDSQDELQHLAARGIRDQIRYFLEEEAQDLEGEAVVVGVAFAGGDQKELSRLAQRRLRREVAVEEIGFLDGRGQERFRLSRKTSFTDQDLRDLSGSPLFRDGMRQDVYWGSVQITETSEPWLTLAVPVRSSESAIIGVFYEILNLKSLWSLIEDLELPNFGRAYVVDQNGRLIAADDSSLVRKQLSFIDRPMIRDLLQLPKPTDRSFSQGTYTNESHVEVMATGLSLANPRWAVVVEQPKSILYLLIRRKLWSFAVVFFVGLAVSSSLAQFLSSRFVRPILQLREGVENLAKGHLEHKVTINTGDEIEALASEFNRMASALKQSYQSLEDKVAERTRDLSTLYAAMAPLVSTDAGGAIRQVLERLRDATRADAALIRIFDKETASYIYPAHLGFPPSYLETTRRLSPTLASERLSAPANRLFRPIFEKMLELKARSS